MMGYDPCRRLLDRDRLSRGRRGSGALESRSGSRRLLLDYDDLALLSGRDDGRKLRGFFGGLGLGLLD
jgi:hypothetical protein